MSYDISDATFENCPKDMYVSYLILSLLQSLKNMVSDASWHMWYHIWNIYNNVPVT